MTHIAAPDGVGIYYEAAGRGPALVLLHGFAMGAERWKSAGYVDALSDTHRVIAVDSRGHGDSQKPHEAEMYTPERMVADVAAVLDHEGVRAAHVWGYSMGGRLALSFVDSAPDRVLSLIVGGFAPTEPTNARDEDATAKLLRAGGIEAYVDSVGSNLTDDARAFFLRNDAEALASVRHALSVWPKVAPEVAQPCLFYAGDQDGFHDATRAYADSSPNAGFVSLAGANHGIAFGVSGPILPSVKAFLG